VAQGGDFMQIGAVGMTFQPYVFNTNTVSASSLNKVSPIADDALTSSVDYYSNSKNQNPLKMGQTSNFADVLAMQMQLGQNNATRVMKPAEEETAAENVQSGAAQAVSLTSEQTAEAVENVVGSVTDPGQSFNQGGTASYLMSRAIDAYTMSLAV